ncbi:MAG: AraC family transcriptional regulator [Gemmatimonadaceae bacterium]|nr:AraC family transcriptional regulator [Gemmatimonadaceae bacterium]
MSDVAFATGFSDQSHLTRQFKRVLGVTPGSYARSYLSSRAP